MKKIIASYLTLNIILAALYVPVMMHTCYLFDKTTTSVFSSISCCETTTSDHESLDARCCSQETEIYSAQVIGVNFDEAFLLVPGSFFVDGYLSQAQSYTSHNLLGRLDIRPPPNKPFNRNLLTSIQVLRI
ncbi:MAG: hypothetical protein JXR10_09745 [Cyclobacteriaceae bacterium]